MQEQKTRDAKNDGQMGRPKAGAPARRDAVLDAAWAVFSEVGYDAAQIGEIADRARASKSTIYKNFRNKEGLLEAVIARMIELRAPEITRTLSAETPSELLRGAGLSILHVLDDEAVRLFRLVIGAASRHPQFGATFFQSIIQAGAIPIGEALRTQMNLPPREAHLRALMFLGALKEPLFIPRLMGAEPLADIDDVLDIAVAMAL